MVKNVLTFTFVFFTFSLFCRVLPKEGQVMNYNTVYFEEQIQTNAFEYELLYGDITLAGNEDHMKRSKNNLPAFWISGLPWASSYCWKVKAYDKEHHELYTSPLHTFFTCGIITKSNQDVRVFVDRNQRNKHMGGLICIDYLRSICDREGNVVWTLPNLNALVDSNTQIRDLRVTKENTITFLAPKTPIEIDLDANILWKLPVPYIFNKDTIRFHHDFRKTKRGTYMVLGERNVYRKLFSNAAEESSKRKNTLKTIGNQVYKICSLSLIMEFNQAGELIWFWDSNEYITDDDLNYKRTKEGLADFSSHQNAFSENEEGTKVYAGFRDLSRILKIDKKTKKIELSYGDKYPSGDAVYANNMFKVQHDASVTNHNSILVFNNNEARARTSSVLELKDNLTKNDKELIWKFDLDFDTTQALKSMTGGNVVELPNSNLFVCAGSLNRLLEVTKSKEVVWSAQIQEKKKTDTTWMTFSQYRSNWTNQLNNFQVLVWDENFKKDKNGVTFSLIVANTGNSDDTYEIEISGNNQIIYKKTKIVVSKGTQLSTTFKKIRSDSKEMNLTIWSRGSGKFFRQMLIIP